MQPIDNVLARLNYEDAGENQWNARCPCRNDDDNPSLRVGVGAQGQVLMNCRRGNGCNLDEICQSIGIEVKDLWPEEDSPRDGKKRNKNITLVATYPYQDANGELVMEVLRYVDDKGKKTFRQRQPNPEGGWKWSTSDLDKPLYRLPQVLLAKDQGQIIYVVEGEKDVETLEKLGRVATTNPGGAGDSNQNKWTDSHTEALAGARVIIISDNDEPGYRHAVSVGKALKHAGSTVKLMRPVDGYKDVTDVIEAGLELKDGLQEFNQHDGSLAEQEASPLDSLIEDLQRLKNSKVPHSQLLGRVSSSFDTFASDEANQYRDPGVLVEWRPFLEEQVDLSYDWVIPNLLERQERVIVVAAEGGGKSTLARQVCLMSAAGIHPFKREPMTPVRTMMIDLENPDRIIRRTSIKIYDKIKQYDLHHDMDAHLLLKPDGVNLLKGEDRLLIEEHVAAVQPEILFFGPLYKAFIDPGGRTAESISTEIARFLDYIRHTYNCALWIEHHAPLGSGGSRDLRPFGSAVWSRWSEFGLALAPDPTDPELIEFRHYRGQREQREWPTICRRGATWPFEPIEFATFEATIAPAGEDRTEEEMDDDYMNREFDDSQGGLW